MGLNKPNDALRVLMEFIKRMSYANVRYPSIYILLADIYRRAGILTDAHKMLACCENYMAAVYRKFGFCAELLRTTYLIALQKWLLEDFAGAAANASLALEAARALKDEAGEIKTLVVLLKASIAIGDTSRWKHTPTLAPGDLCRDLLSVNQRSSYKHERAIAYVTLVEAHPGLEDSLAESHARHAYHDLQYFYDACTGYRKEKLAEFLALIPVDKVQISKEELPLLPPDVLVRLYEEVMTLQPRKWAKCSPGAETSKGENIFLTNDFSNVEAV